MSDRDQQVPMTSTKPYLLRAFYEWIADNFCTPFLVVNAEMEQVNVPTQYVEDGRIVLNISPNAVKDLLIDNEGVSFRARFSGQVWRVYAPLAAIQAIYARENGRGMVFNDNDEEEGGAATLPPQRAPGHQQFNNDNPTPPDKPTGKKGGKPKLTVIK